MSPSKLTKYCACHAKWPSNISQKFAENSWNVISNARPIRAGSDHDPRPFREWTRQSATRRATELTFRAPDEQFLLKNTTFRDPAIFPNFTKYCACHEKWHWTFTKYCAYHAKWHLHFTKYCTCREKWHWTFTKYCTCHEKWHLTFTNYFACHTEWLAGLILVTYETSFPMRGATNVTLQTHQILRLPRKMTIQHLAEIWAGSDHDPRPFREWTRQSATRRATELTFRAPDEHFLLKNTTFPDPAIFLNFTKYCACHEKWQLNFTKYCAYHEK